MALRKLPAGEDVTPISSKNPCSEIPMDPVKPKMSFKDKLHRIIDVVFKPPSLTRDERIQSIRDSVKLTSMMLPNTKDVERSRLYRMLDYATMVYWIYLGITHPLLMCTLLTTVYLSVIAVMVPVQTIYIEDRYEWLMRISDKYWIISFILAIVIYIGVVIGIWLILADYFLVY
jgi:hypothetical protein